MTVSSAVRALLIRNLVRTCAIVKLTFTSSSAYFICSFALFFFFGAYCTGYSTDEYIRTTFDFRFQEIVGKEESVRRTMY